jgi:hypothetical protein
MRSAIVAPVHRIKKKCNKCFDSSRNLAQCDSTCDFPSPIQYKKEYRLAEAEFLPDDGLSHFTVKST